VDAGLPRTSGKLRYWASAVVELIDFTPATKALVRLGSTGMLTTDSLKRARSA
jgi:hypothetical protein